MEICANINKEAKSCFSEKRLLIVLYKIVDARYQKRETNRNLLLTFVSSVWTKFHTILTISHQNQQKVPYSLFIQCGRGVRKALCPFLTLKVMDG